jgi:hypothetical protein
MKHLFSLKLGALALVAAASSVLLLHPHKAAADEDLGTGRTYLLTLTDSTGAFASREVLTLHPDYTFEVTDNNQGGPTSHFTSTLGAWKFDGNGGILAKGINFDIYPSNEDVARQDYAITFHNGGNQVSGTFSFTIFLLQGNPLGGGGTTIGPFHFTGYLVTP